MRFHVQMEADRFTRVEGLDPGEARRQAHLRFGAVEKYKEVGRERAGSHGSTASGSTRGSVSACSSSTGG